MNNKYCKIFKNLSDYYIYQLFFAPQFISQPKNYRLQNFYQIFRLIRYKNKIIFERRDTTRMMEKRYPLLTKNVNLKREVQDNNN